MLDLIRKTTLLTALLCTPAALFAADGELNAANTSWILTSTALVLLTLPGLALFYGLLAGSVCFVATLTLKQKLKIDDSLDVFPVHGVGVIPGTLLAGVFSATTLGVFSGFGFADGITTIGGQLGVQLTGVAATVTFTAVATYVLLKIIDLTIGLRVTEEQEVEGLDIALHEERGYVGL